MNSYTDIDMSILNFIAVISLATSLALLITLVPFVSEQENRLDKLEKELVVELDEEVK